MNASNTRGGKSRAEGWTLPIPSIKMNDEDIVSSCSIKEKSSKRSRQKRLNESNKTRQETAKMPDFLAPKLMEGRRERQGNIKRVSESTGSFEEKLGENSLCQSSSAEAISPDQRHSAMERADLSPYSSDAWEADSDTDGDHSDSSDDDDPKSQVDRLIEQGTLMYLNGENSALSSEGESDDDYDSESDITDVSPLVSATPSPLGLSPVLPRRTAPTSPLALHDNNELLLQYRLPSNSESDYDSDTPYHERPEHPPMSTCSTDATNMDLLLRAVIELENQNENDHPHHNHRNSKHHRPHNHVKTNSSLSDKSSNGFLHPIRDNPHHHHLRKNMSFSNEEVRKIDRENKILLKKIMAAHSRSKNNCPPFQSNNKHHRPTNAAVNRRKNDERIRRDNLVSTLLFLE